MPLSLKIKYFNTFILREEPFVTTSITSSVSSTGTPPVLGESSQIDLTDSNPNISFGQKVSGPGILDDVTVTAVSGTTVTISKAQKIEKGSTLTFSSASPYPDTGATQLANNEWHIEESRIKGEFNGKTVDFGAKAYAVDKEYNRNHRENAMIYSGIYNSRTRVNNTNQFSIGESITKAVDRNYGSIQKLYAEDTNLIIFQENKVNGALIDKDAIFTAEGSGLSTTAKVVIGQITPYVGEYGIGTNPESFAVFGFRKYFVDKDQGCVLRLSRDGITDISSYGMRTFFRENLKNTTKAYGMFDIHSKSYVLSLDLDKPIQQNKQTFIKSTTAVASSSSKGKEIKIKAFNQEIQKGQYINCNAVKNNSLRVVSVKNKTITVSKNVGISEGESLSFIAVNDFGLQPIERLTNFVTIGFDDKVNGWTSFYTFNPTFGGSVQGGFYTFNKGNLYKHHSNILKNTFYEEFEPSTITLVSNQNPSLVKHYKTINYEGTNNWKVIDMFSPAEDNENYNAYQIPGNITGRYFDETNYVKYAGFCPLEKKYFAHIKINDTSTITGVQGLTTTGIKGFFAETTLEHEPVTNDGRTDKTKHAELFSVGFNYEQSLY